MDIATKHMEVYKLVSDLSAEERQRIFDAVAALCGDRPQRSSAVGGQTPPALEDAGGLPAKAARWMAQYRISRERVDDLFHVDGTKVEVIAREMIGKSKREQTINCYLLSGIRSLLATGEPTIADAEVVALCKRYKCHDPNNHSAYRKKIANYLAGDKERGFVLSAPGLRTAANLIPATA